MVEESRTLEKIR